MIFPLGLPRDNPNGGWRGLNGLALLVTRLERGFAARALGQVAFVFAEGESSQKGKNRRPTFQQFRRLTWRNVFRSGEATSSRPRRLAPTPVMRTS